MTPVPHSRPLLGREEERAARRVIASGMLAQGEEVGAFEREMAAHLERRYAVAVSSGTAALHLALASLRIGAGDRVAVPSYCCTALLHAVSLAGAAPLVVDVDPSTFNLDPDDLRRRLARTQRAKAVIVAHMFGLPAETGAVAALGLPVIEDCALAIGSGAVGRWGALAVTSFYATKMMTTGEGGMLLGDGAKLLHAARDLRSYDGRRRHRARFNYKMTDLQAAIGRVQLRRLQAFVSKRRRLAALYRRVLAGRSLELPVENAHHAYYRFVVRVPSASRWVAELGRRGVEARRPVYLPLHRYLGLDRYPGAEDAYRRAVSIPLYPALKRRDAERVAAALSSGVARKDK